VNQVFEILINWVETRDWEEAFYSVIPKRKFVTDGKKWQNNDSEEEAQDDGEESERNAEAVEIAGGDGEKAST